MSAENDRIDEIDKLVSQAKGVIFLMGAGRIEDPDPHQTALANAAWLLDEHMERIRNLAMGKTA